MDDILYPTCPPDLVAARKARTRAYAIWGGLCSGAPTGDPAAREKYIIEECDPVRSVFLHQAEWYAELVRRNCPPATVIPASTITFHPPEEAAHAHP